MGKDLCRIRATFVNSCLRELRFVQRLRAVQPGAYFTILFYYIVILYIVHVRSIRKQICMKSRKQQYKHLRAAQLVRK